MIASIGSIRSGINRIRLEFKDAFAVIFYNDDFVLIESDWNLKSLQHSVL